MRLKTSGIELQCVDDGWQLRVPASINELHAEAFERVRAAHQVGADFMLPIPQTGAAEGQRDLHDRVRSGAALLRDLVAAGL